MNDLIQINTLEVVITLKEITDLISVRHDKAMLKVEELCKEPSFGEVSKIDTFNLNNVKVATYQLNKKQAIAVGAKLNNSLLMKVIDRLEELEASKKVALPSAKELALMVVKAEEEKEKLLLDNNKKSEFISNVVHNNTTYSAIEVAKDLNISAKLFNKVLLEAKVLFRSGETYVLASKYQSYKLTEFKETTPRKTDGKTFKSLRWTSKGKNWIMSNFDTALQRCSRETFDEYNKYILSNLPKIPMPKKQDRNF